MYSAIVQCRECSAGSVVQGVQCRECSAGSVVGVTRSAVSLREAVARPAGRDILVSVTDWSLALTHLGSIQLTSAVRT